MNRRWSFVFPALVIAIALLAATVAASHWRPDEPIRTEAIAEPVWADATVTYVTDEFEATVTATFAPPRELLLHTSGIVGDVAIEPGDSVTDGALMFVVDGRPIVAIESETPLWRSLTGGSRGGDVEVLQRFLVRRGLFDQVDVDGVYGTGTQQAWYDYLEAIGVDRRDVYAPSHEAFAWLPTASFEVGSVEISAGSSVAEGAVAVIERPRLVALNINEPDDAPPIAGASWEVEVEGASMRFDRGSQTLSLPVDHRFVFEPDVDYQGVVRRSEPLLVRSVPATAVLSGESGSCVVTRIDGEQVVVAVRVRDGSLGVAFVSGLDANIVLANPASSGAMSECPD